jgi:hypothetical protein
MKFLRQRSPDGPLPQELDPVKWLVWICADLKLEARLLREDGVPSRRMHMVREGG